MIKKIIKLISLGLIIVSFNACVRDNNTLKTSMINNEVKTKIITPKIKDVPIPYVRESKFIKILVLPFENSENDIDYGGYIETKLESSKFIFDEQMKNKIVVEDTIGGI
ncbi:hypothetical protein [Arcobacter sp. L]|uniref:hypothetical protein n=1 Tax=Arcobacter sp. L TaxID=944547 RepID=UPI0002296455|nr:hypothetical protein [Arcobacter sp. L]BAK73167.1 hypothetical protein ABLL_1292 [Arcobacter sp. L]